MALPVLSGQKILRSTQNAMSLKLENAVAMYRFQKKKTRS